MTDPLRGFKRELERTGRTAPDQPLPNAPEYREAMKRYGKTSDLDNLLCPFCGEGDFDFAGLKSHLLHGDCEPFNEAENLTRIWDFNVVPETEYLDEGKPDD